MCESALNVHTAQPGFVNIYNRPREPAHAATMVSGENLGVRGFDSHIGLGKRVTENNF
jgi:hypothetical protein